MASTEIKVACLFCGKVRTDGVWRRDVKVMAQALGFCPPCGRHQKRAYERKRAREIRDIREGRTNARTVTPTDPFEGFREGTWAAGTSEGSATGPAPSLPFQTEGE